MSLEVLVSIVLALVLVGNLAINHFKSLGAQETSKKAATKLSKKPSKIASGGAVASSGKKQVDAYAYIEREFGLSPSKNFLAMDMAPFLMIRSVLQADKHKKE